MGRDLTKDRLLDRKTLQNEIAQRLDSVGRKKHCHLSRAHGDLLHALGDCSQSADEIDGGANHREIQAIGASDVTVSGQSPMNHLTSQSFL
jgi:hypothetical protein